MTQRVMIIVSTSIKAAITATTIAAIAPALRPVPESPGEPFDSVVVSVLRIYVRAN